MRGWLVVGLLLLMADLMAQEPPTGEKRASPLHDVSVSERPVYTSFAPRNINLRHITTSPAGINARPNDILRATYGGNERLCVATGAGPYPTTTWSCVTLVAP